MTRPVIQSLDHLVLTVSHIARTVAFYTRVLGMEAVTFGPEGRQALHFGAQKINLHQAGAEFEPKAAWPVPGSGDLCFLTQTPISAVVAHLEAEAVAVEIGPVQRAGAAGPLVSVYCRDPDGNLIEISTLA